MSPRDQATELVSSCAYFELRGPLQAALVRVGETSEILRESSRWPASIAERISEDNRMDISDLIRPGRQRFLRALERIEDASGPTVKPSGPKLG